eukprot:CAMPEP_0180810652 /NCGR_PEP_ID=MMETSP1038_2-20121128/65002_1 /TAXON_ID=632150 /ORGANISM="Azadinium spinosum, Strain 3D9" /LENGTH=301 /DNA_ID=CAMNT_0022851963 /DNA_START=1 /DNA_END=903 /DNA_ORIENTATION=-
MIGFLRHVDPVLASVLGATVDWYNDFKLWLGIAFVCIFYADDLLKARNCGWKPLDLLVARWIEIVGLDLCMLHFTQQYDTGLQIALSLGALHFFTITSIQLSRAAAHQLPFQFSAANVFQDLDGPLKLTVVVFAGQCMLICFFMESLLTWAQRVDGISYGCWLTAVVAIQMSAIFGRGADSQLGFAFRIELWTLLLDWKLDPRILVVRKNNKEELKISYFKIWSRAAMAFLINGVLRSLVGVSIPLILMQSRTPSALLEHCLAMAFIFQLDDCSSGGKYEVVLHRNPDSRAVRSTDSRELE